LARGRSAATRGLRRTMALAASIFCVASLAAATLVVIRRQDNWGFYADVQCFQLTIWSIHAMPLVSWQLLCAAHPGTLSSNFGLTIALLWPVATLACRRCRPTVFSAFFVAYEAYWACVHVAPALVDGLLVLQGLIVLVVWTAILVASCSSTVSVTPLDKHLRQGLAHVLLHPDGRDQLGRELHGHFLLQGLSIASARLCRPGRLLETSASQVFLALLLYVLAYAVGTMLVAVVFPPHELPYDLGRLPGWMRFEARMGQAETLGIVPRGGAHEDAKTSGTQSLGVAQTAGAWNREATQLVGARSHG